MSERIALVLTLAIAAVYFAYKDPKLGAALGVGAAVAGVLLLVVE
ncbi:hypothetical protein [Streptomyces sp. UNOC14_S4]|nr:hypothetical protein [Streptomyces sp. UNOC14_S4]